MMRRSLVLNLFAIGCFMATAALIPSLGIAQTDKVKASIESLKAETAKLGTPTLKGKSLYFGEAADYSEAVHAVVKMHGGIATLFVRRGDRFVVAATTVTKKDGTSPIGMALDASDPAVAKLTNGDAYYGDGKVFGNAYETGYEPIKDVSGAVIGAYAVGQPK